MTRIASFTLPTILASFLALAGCGSDSPSGTDNTEISSSSQGDEGVESSGTSGSNTSSADSLSTGDKGPNTSSSATGASATSSDASASGNDDKTPESSGAADIPAESSADQSSSESNLTAPAETFTDSRDGKTYKLTKIGTQTWMAENLNYGDSALYTYSDAQKVCPEDFHLPTLKEFQTLVAFLGGKAVAGKKLKSTTGWPKDDEHGDWNGTDEYGFNAKPVESGDGTGTDENFWSSTINTRDIESADFLKINAFPVFKSDDESLRGAFVCDEAMTAEKPADLACFINGLISTKLSVRCLSNIEECGGKNIDNTKQFCQDGVAYDICRHRQYDGTKYECKNDTLYERSSGEVFKFTWFLLNPSKTYGTFQDDRDGQTYKTIEIDGVTWFAENLNYPVEGSLCPMNDDSYCDVYGRLYTGLQILGDEKIDTSKHQGACPKGTHVATYSEFDYIVEKFDVHHLFTAYTKYFVDDDFGDSFGYLDNESGLTMLENGAYDREDGDDWSGINRLSRYIGSNFNYYLYYRWAPSGVSESYYYNTNAPRDDESFGSVRCVVD